MFGATTIEFLEAGSALIVGTVDDDGVPHAGRAWGLDVVTPGDHPMVRILLDVDDTTTVEHVAAGGAVAVTATNVRTLESMQLKGRATGLDEPHPDDDARFARYTDQFFTDIVETDGTDRALLEGFRAYAVVPALVRVEACFTQTPGPGAGAPSAAAP